MIYHHVLVGRCRKESLGYKPMYLLVPAPEGHSFISPPVVLRP